MNISDEQLSAFLDAALADSEMQLIREHLAEDENLVARLADLAMVDPIVQQHYAQIDQQPLPETLLALLQHDTTLPKTDSDNVIYLSRWQHVQQQWQRYAAAVACVALFGGYGISQLNSPEPGSMLAIQPAVQQHLSQSVSGQTYDVTGQQLTPQLSFVNQDGDFCRQYSLQSASERSEHIACQQQGQWQLKASIASLPVMAQTGYQTASGGSALDAMLDQFMVGPALTLAEEQQRLKK